MASLSRLYSHPIEPGPKAARELCEALPPNGHHSLGAVAIRAALTAAGTVGPRAALSVACAATTTNDHASSVESSRPARHGQRAGARRLEAEFKTLYDAHLRLVWRALRRLGVREADRMDLTQKVFLTAYRKMPQFDGRSPVSTWLWGICRRTASAYRRSREIRREIATDPISLQKSIDHHAGASCEVDSNRHVAAHLLSKLPEQQRIVFTLFEVVELDGPEIAALLDVPLGTVRSRLRYARKRFRREVRRFNPVSAFPKTLLT